MMGGRHADCYAGRHVGHHADCYAGRHAGHHADCYKIVPSTIKIAISIYI